MPDFNQDAPPATVTNPQSLPKGEYPKTLYKFGDGKNSLVVAWDDEKPISNQIVTVTGPEDEGKKLAQGYALDPVLKAAKK